MDDIRDAGVVEDRRDDISLCQSVKAVWERERRLDARSARPFLGYQSHVNQIQEYITIEKMKHLTNPLPFPPPFTGLTPTPRLTSFSSALSPMRPISGLFPCRKIESREAEPACEFGSVAKAMCVVEIVRK